MDARRWIHHSLHPGVRDRSERCRELVRDFGRLEGAHDEVGVHTRVDLRNDGRHPAW